MSFWRGLLGDVRQLVLMDDKMSRMEKRLDKLDTSVSDQEKRLVQVEYVIFGPIPPDHLRSPRIR